MRLPFVVFFLVFAPSLPGVNQVGSVQTVCWILAAAVILFGGGMALGATLERRESGQGHDEPHLLTSTNLQHGENPR